MTIDARLIELIEKLDKHIDSDNVALTKSAELLTRLDERGVITAEQIDRLTHVLLDGNGTPALTITVARLDERLQKLEDNADKKKLSGGDKALIYTTAIGGLFTMIDMIVRHIH